MSAESLVDELRAARKVAGLSQRHVAEKLVHTWNSSVAEWERAVHIPNLDSFVRWADALGYDVTLVRRGER